MPPTSQIVKNVVEELCGGPVDKNWVGRFTKRYKHRLRAVYLRTIDRKRVSLEFISLLACIYIDGTTLLVGLIYKGILHDL
jgi:hypothetical protein